MYLYPNTEDTLASSDPSIAAAGTVHGEDPTGYVPKIHIYNSPNASAHLQSRLRFAVMKQRTMSGWLYKICPGFANFNFFPSSDPSGNPQRT